jgi:hypothetical protein
MPRFLENRRVRKILQNGGPQTAKEYFFIFPRACPSCGGRNAKHTRMELDYEQRWNSFGGFYENKYSGWKEWTECQRCNCVYDESESAFYETVRPSAKNIRTLGPSTVTTLKSGVSWHKIIDIEGFKVDEIPQEIPKSRAAGS